MSRHDLVTRQELWVAHGIWWLGSFFLIFVLSWRLSGELATAHRLYSQLYQFVREAKNEMGNVVIALNRLELEMHDWNKQTRTEGPIQIRWRSGGVGETLGGGGGLDDVRFGTYTE